MCITSFSNMMKTTKMVVICMMTSLHDVTYYLRQFLTNYKPFKGGGGLKRVQNRLKQTYHRNPSCSVVMTSNWQEPCELTLNET